MSTWIDPPRRRGHHPWDSDSDDDLDADLDAHRDLYFGPGAAADDERMIAAYRGHLVSGKKVPTKEAIASLEAVNLEGLKDDSKLLPCTQISSKFSFPAGLWTMGLYQSPVLSNLTIELSLTVTSMLHLL